MITFHQLLEQLRKPQEISDFRNRTREFDKPDSRDANKWQATIPELMNRYGFKPVGTGKYGSVFANDRYPYVIKVFMKDTAYLRWLSFAKQNQNNPLVPKIRGKVVRISNNFMAVRLEKLTPIKSDDDMANMWDQLEKTPHGNKVDKFLNDNQKLLDMHAGNIMLRGNQPVIVDPFYNFFRNGMPTIDPDDISGFKNLFVKV